MTTKMLCGIDGQEHSARAAGVAFELAKRLRAEVTLYMVNPALAGRGGPLYLWSAEYIERILDEAVQRARWSGVVNVKCEDQHAISISDAIVAYADQHEVDYIIIGASDRPGFVKVLSGSVSREVAAKANCPVLVVRRVRGQRQRRHDGGILERILSRETVPSVA
jgi:nucleotide-binding universal stress UspA family protein